MAWWLIWPGSVEWQLGGNPSKNPGFNDPINSKHGRQETNLVNFKKTNRALPPCVKYDILHSHFVRNFHMVAYRQGGLGPLGGRVPHLLSKICFWHGRNLLIIFMSGCTPLQLQNSKGLNFGQSSAKHVLRNTQNDWRHWLSDSSRVHKICFLWGIHPGPSCMCYQKGHHWQRHGYGHVLWS